MKKIAINVVRKQINQWDPMDLLKGGAPNDEYDDEIETITNGALESKDEIEVAEVIKDTLDFTFQSEFSFDECLVVAKNIWTELYE